MTKTRYTLRLTGEETDALMEALYSAMERDAALAVRAGESAVSHGGGFMDALRADDFTNEVKAYASGATRLARIIMMLEGNS